MRETEDELRARVLREMLVTHHSIVCEVHWDRSPWGVRIPFTEERGEYNTPSLFVLTEGLRVANTDMWYWDGSLGGFTEDDDDVLQETMFRWVQRDGLLELASTIASAYDFLKYGVLAFGGKR